MLPVISLLVVLLVLLALWFYVFIFGKSNVTSSSRSRRRDDEENDPLDALRDRAIAGYDRVERTVNVASYEDKRINRLADCSIDTRYCATKDDCFETCRIFKHSTFECDLERNVCTVVPDFSINTDEDKNGAEGTGSEIKTRCKQELGEYALLIGYSTLGHAQWQCVQLYKHFVDTEKYCEGGRIDMQAHIREPSYADCVCPEGTVRSVYRKSSFYDNALPHCVPTKQWRFFRSNMIRV